MFKVFSKLRESNYLLFALVLSFVYSILFNTPYYYTILNGDLLITAIAVLLGAVQVAVLWYILGLNKWVFLLLGLITFLLSTSFSYYVAVYKVEISVGLIRVILLADPREISGFFEPAALIWAAFTMAGFIFFTFWLFNIRRKPKAVTAIISIIILGLAAGGAKSIEPKVIKRDTSMPYVFYEHIYHYALEAQRIKKFLSNKTDVSELAKFEAELPEELIVMVMVGESMRGDHMSLNGYERQTNKYMEQLGALSFPKALSCTTFTSHSVTCMFTRATLANWEDSLKETTFISIFNKLGFDTYWLSNQGRVGHDKWVGSVAIEANNISFCDDKMTIGGNTHDTCMLPKLDEYLNDPAKHKLIVMHLYGSHVRYDDRYFKEQEIFTPVCDKSKGFSECVGEELINIYDNSLVSTDEFFKDVADKLKDKNAIVFFLSDHAEPLGENGVRARGDYGSVYQRHIPFIVWMSDKMKENSDIYPIIKGNLNKSAGHDNLIYSVLDCIGVQSDFIDKSQSICNIDMVPLEDPLIKWE